MGHIGVICSPVPGHMIPLSSFADALEDAGHKVTFFNVEDVQEFIQKRGHHFCVVGEQRFPLGTWQKHMEPLSKKSGLAVILGTSKFNTLLAEIYCEDIPEKAKALGIDAFLIDQIQFQGSVIAEKVGVPFASVTCGVRLNRDSNLSYPPPFVPWPHSESLATKALNHLAFKGMDLLTSPILKVARQHAQKWNVKVPRTIDDTFSTVLDFYPFNKEFDFPFSRVIGSEVFLGPYKSPRRVSVPFDYSKLDDRPLVYASFGTLNNGLLPLYQKVADAFKNLPEYQLVMSLGNSAIEPEQITVAENVLVEKFLPQPELLKRAVLCITHGGFNTTIESLSEGLPLVAIPLSNDQPAICARIKSHGAGLVLDVNKTTPLAIEHAVQKVLATPGYKASADKIKNAIDETPGLLGAVRLIEEKLLGAQI
ncbi:glycosyltransferase [Bdellovibrio sp. HCB337]|uniref:glycosyltransferase n=1 Tax=Bdellovibrio sp. HCB337 TaxID=3394358 RepID=UPI0039A6F286